MLKIALTGGIGAGKSTVSKMLEDLNVPVIDADRIAQRLTAEDSSVITRVGQEFPEALDADGQLDRKKLRAVVFGDAERRKQLEQILHPAVKAKINQSLKKLGDGAYCIIVIPLLIEANMTDAADKIAVVDCPIEQQITRTMQRDHCDRQSVLDVLKAQADRETRLANADFIIHNTGDLAELAEQLLALNCRWKEMAK